MFVQMKWFVGCLLLVGLALPCQAQQPAPDLHLIIVADTDESGAGAGPSCTWAAAAMIDLLLESKPPGKEVQLKLIAGKRNFPKRLVDSNRLKTEKGPDNFSQSELVDHLKTMPCGSNTRVVFYFMGHGDYTDEEGHRILMPSANGKPLTPFPTEKIHQVIFNNNPNGKKVQLLVMLTESCCVVIGPGGDPKLRPGRASLRGPQPGPGSKKSVQQLFYEAYGVIQINGARQYDYGFFDSKSNTAPPFTQAILKTMRANEDKLVDASGTDGILTWRDVLPRITRETRIRYEEIYKDHDNATGVQLVQPDGAKRQMPQVFRLVQIIPKREGKLDPPRPKYRAGIGFENKEGEAKVLKIELPASAVLKEGDIIRRVNGMTVRNGLDLQGLLEFTFTDEAEVEVEFTRGGADMKGKFKRVAPD